MGYCMRTKDANFVPSPIVLHEEFISSYNMGVQIPGGGRISLIRFGQMTVGAMYHAKASSIIFASHVKAGFTTPGLKNVPMPGCEADQR